MKFAQAGGSSSYQCIQQKPAVWILPHCAMEEKEKKKSTVNPHQEQFVSLFWKVPEAASGQLEIRMSKSTTKDGVAVQIPTMVNKRQVNEGDFITHAPRKKPKVQA